MAEDPVEPMGLAEKARIETGRRGIWLVVHRGTIGGRGGGWSRRLERRKKWVWTVWWKRWVRLEREGIVEGPRRINSVWWFRFNPQVAAFLLIGAEYGHLMTLRRLCALVEYLKRWVLEAWGACSHKKIVAASAATVFWNLTAIRTRIFAAFIFVVILRSHRQHLGTKVEGGGQAEGEQQEQQQKALVVVEKEDLKSSTN
ncbi:reticulon family protein [Actinidia rufa]|uniref:Reticulon family protein n=1 Tax=Actinidia rufa TaxID=165716 RepID=A0A7J0DIE2_9ERIC|nr:reticulon family protein [Actinidia rufa]